MNSSKKGTVRKGLILLLILSLFGLFFSVTSFDTDLKTTTTRYQASKQKSLYDHCVNGFKRNWKHPVRPITWKIVLNKFDQNDVRCVRIKAIFIGARILLLFPILIFFYTTYKKEYLWWFIPFLIGFSLIFYLESDIKNPSFLANPLIENVKLKNQFKQPRGLIDPKLQQAVH